MRLFVNDMMCSELGAVFGILNSLNIFLAGIQPSSQVSESFDETGSSKARLSA